MQKNDNSLSWLVRRFLMDTEQSTTSIICIKKSLKIPKESVNGRTENIKTKRKTTIFKTLHKTLKNPTKLLWGELMCSGTVRSSCSTSDTRRDKNADNKFSVAIIRYAQSQICESQINQKYLGARQPMGLYRLAKILF